jgi:hypothetical protein
VILDNSSSLITNVTVPSGRTSDYSFICLVDGCYTSYASSNLAGAYWTLTADAHQNVNVWSTGTLGVEEFLDEASQPNEFCVSNGTFSVALTPSPTLSPLPTSMPSPQPTPLPTAQPTPLPTPVPSGLPTLKPSPVPTLQPFPAPSAQPTLIPSPLPTTEPTPLPTPSPSPIPTSSPSPYPTPVPSPYCLPGTELIDNVCTDCVAGKYSNFTNGTLKCRLCESEFISAAGASQCTRCADGKYSPPSRTVCESCPAGTKVDSAKGECVVCPMSRYNPVAQTDFCTACAAGSATLVANGSSECSSCSPGTYNDGNGSYYTCLDCNVGKYSGTRADACTDCEAGTFSASTGAASCQSCDAGTYSNASASQCESCGNGTFSLTRASECTECAAGSFNHKPGAASCTACASGKYMNDTGALFCTDCAVGTYQGATSQSKCFECEAGKYVSTEGATFCISCDTGYWSVDGDDACEICEAGYYWGYLVDENDRATSEANGYDGYGCETCPDNAVCRAGEKKGDLFMPVPEDGYWLDRSAVAQNPLYIRSIYKCARATCNVQTTDDDAARRRLLSSVDCDTFANFTSAECQDASLTCVTGSTGPLCGACKEGYTFSAALSRCDLCGGAWYQVIIVVSVGVVAAVLLWTMRSGTITVPQFAQKQFNLAPTLPIPIIGVIASIDSGALKLLWSTFQIVQSVSFNLNVTFPYPYTEITKWLAFIQLDFLNIDCLNGTFYLNVYLSSAFPMILALVCWLIYGIRYLIETCLGFINSHHQKEVLHELYSEHMHAFLLLIYIFVPPVANTQFKALDCQELDNGDSYVRTDTSVDCNSDGYKEFVIYDSILIVIFQSLPLLYIILLCRVRDRLRPKTANPNLALEIRDHDESLKSVQFLFKDYKCNRWYFEISDLYRRIIFVSVISLIDSKSSTRAYAGCGLALLSTIYFRELTPFRVEFTNFLAVVAQYVILLAYMAALMIGTDSLSKFNVSDFWLGLILSSTNFLIVFMALFIGWRRYRRDQHDIKLRTAKPVKIEFAADFTENKFNTTFEFVTQRSLPASHVLCFYYTSMSQAHDSIRLGNIPAMNKEAILNLRPHGGLSNATSEEEYEKDVKNKYDELLSNMSEYDLKNQLVSENKFSGGVLVSLRGPQMVKGNDNCLTSLGVPEISTAREAVLCLALPHSVLYPLPTIPGVDEESMSHMRVVPADLLHAMGQYVPPPKPKAMTIQQRRSTVAASRASSSGLRGGPMKEGSAVAATSDVDPTKKVDPEAPVTKEGSAEAAELRFKEARKVALTIPTKCVLRAFQLVDDKEISAPALSIEHLSLKKKLSTLGPEGEIVPIEGSQQTAVVKTVDQTDIGDGAAGEAPKPVGTDEEEENVNLVFSSPSLCSVYQPKTCIEYINLMSEIRTKCDADGLVPLYHYTMPAIAPMILKGGFRMSTQGQGDGGVYFSTLGPSSYELGSSSYEENIIIDCFGKERLEEYRGKHKLDLLFVYGVNPKSVEQAPGGRENAKMVGKAIFEDLSLPSTDGNYFLRPDMIKGCFLLDPTSGFPEGRDDSLDELENEKLRDKQVQKILKDISHEMKKNSSNTKEARMLRGMYVQPAIGHGHGHDEDKDQASSSSSKKKVVKKPSGSKGTKSLRSVPPSGPSKSSSSKSIDNKDGGDIELASSSSSSSAPIKVAKMPSRGKKDMTKPSPLTQKTSANLVNADKKRAQMKMSSTTEATL